MVERRSAQDFVRCPESGSVRFSEVANILQLWYFQSVTRQVSVVAWVSASRRVRYGRFHCIYRVQAYCMLFISSHVLLAQYNTSTKIELSYKVTCTQEI